MRGMRASAVVGALGVTVGLAALWVARDTQDAAHAAIDLVTGWAIIVCGLVGRASLPSSRTGTLLVVAGFAWFALNFGALPDPWGAAMAALAFVHRGVLVHAIVTFPRGRLDSLGTTALVVAGYVAVLATPLWTYPVAAALLALALVLAVLVVAAQRPGRFRRVAPYPMWAAASLAGAILVGALVRAFTPTPGATSAASVGYAVGIVGCAVLLLLGLLATRRRADVADLVIEVGTTTGRSLQEALAWAFGDSRLRLELADADARGGGSGAGLSDRARLGAGAALSAGPQRAVTVVFDTDGVAIAALDHADGDLDEPGLADAVTAVVRLDVNNARLRARVGERVDQLRESQRRLLRAADDESRRLVARLDGGAGARLGRIGKLVDEAAGLAVSDATADELAGARARLDETVAELDAIGHGLAPRALSRDGLAAALVGAAARSRVPLTVDIEVPELPDDIETAVYFCVVEAVTNIDKHAAARAGQVAVRTGDGAVRIEVVDDGVGGARPAPGSGLQGVADRITALGGTLDVTGGDHEGTAVRATLPLPPSTRGFDR